MFRREVLCGLGAAPFFGLAGCAELFAHSFRVRMNMRARAFGEPVAGTSVYEVSAYNTGSILPEGAKRNWRVRGDALAMRLPNGQMIVALKRVQNPISDDFASMIMGALDPSFQYDIVESAERIESGQDINSRANVSPESHPDFLIFKDMRNSENIIQIFSENNGTHSGSSFLIDDINLEITSDQISVGLKDNLPPPPYKARMQTSELVCTENLDTRLLY